MSGIHKELKILNIKKANNSIKIGNGSEKLYMFYVLFKREAQSH